VKALAIELDGVLGDTHPLWEAWLDDAGRRYRVELGTADEATLDERLGNWRVLLERFAEDHAPVYLRPRPESTAALRRLASEGVRLGAFTNAPEPLARVALAHLGGSRLIDVLEAGPGALERLLEQLGPGTALVRGPEELARAAA
jgi:phosphoglycolate phosphatase-like HAD superfamily hydrolase